MTAAEFSDWLYRNAPDSLLVCWGSPVRTLLAKRGVRVPDDIGLAYLYRTSDEMGGAAGIDGNLDFVVGGGAGPGRRAALCQQHSVRLSEHPKEVLIKGTWYEGDTLPPRKTPPAPSRSRGPAKAKP